MVSRTILEEAWLKLDVCVTSLYEDSMDSEETTRMKGVCRGMAEIIALFMLPYFTNGDEVTKEAVARYKAKKNGETDYETPGIGGRRFAPPPGTSAASKPQAAPRATPSHKLKDNEVAAIKNAMTSGMFTAAELARTYGVSAAVIEQIVSV